MQKILIAEDDKYLSNAYRLKLENAGFTVKIVGDGTAALAALEQESFDALVLDLVMPNMDGFETLEALQHTPHAKNMPILITSNLGQQEDIDKALELGATKFFVKSNTELQTLVDEITTLIQSKVE